VPGSRLLMKNRPLIDPQVCSRIRDEFGRNGVGPQRIELHGGNAAPVEHLAQYQRVDIALDTFPYNGTTTSCEALWMGVPVVALEGTRHAARTGVSILTNCGLERLLAKDCEQYLSIAVGLAADQGKLSELRRGLRERMQTSALMDGAGVTRELERALVGILKEETGGWRQNLRSLHRHG
jgi:protein O-GlcNAc transferase